MGLAGDGVGLVTALQGDELEIVLQFREQEAHQLPDRVAAALLDVVSAVAAHAAADAHFQGLIALFEGFSVEFEDGGSIQTAGAAHKELAFVLRVQVDEGFGIEKARFQAEGAVHAGFFRDGEQALQLSGGKVAGQKGQAGGNAYAVICPKGGVLGHHPAVFYHVRDGLGFEVEVKTGVFLANHILMGLQGQCGHLFLARGRFLDNEHVTGFIRLAL